MTNRIKTVQYPRVVLVAMQNPDRIIEMISDIMNYCTYNTVIDDFSENTDFVIETESFDINCPENAVADTLIFDESCRLDRERIAGFRQKVTPYENVGSISQEESEGLITYSLENYGADVTLRNVTEENGRASCDLLCGGILSRLSFDSSRFTGEEVLISIAALLAAGMPMASVLNFFAAE